MHWHIALTQPGQDKQAAEALRARCYLVYDPKCYRRVNLSRGRRVRKLQPMFPGYLFVDAGGTKQAPLQSWERLRTAPGIRTSDPLLKINGWYVSVPETVIDEIRRTELEKIAPLELPPAFQPGEEVKITDGPWAGYFGPVDRLDGDAAVRLLLDVFGRPTPVSISIKHVAPVEMNGLSASHR